MTTAADDGLGMALLTAPVASVLALATEGMMVGALDAALLDLRGGGVRWSLTNSLLDPLASVSVYGFFGGRC